MNQFIPTSEEEKALAQFKAEHQDLFKKSDSALIKHLAIVISLLVFLTGIVFTTPFLWLKIALGPINAFLWFCLINVTIHHHKTHHNAASHPAMKKAMDIIYFIAVPNAPKRTNRYTRAHLNHHARPFHETDVDHHYGKNRYMTLMKNPLSALGYFLELTFVGGHMPGWEDDRYMNNVPLEKWNQKDYQEIKKAEVKKALQTSAIQWGAFLLALVFIPSIAWAWAFPMLLVKNWAHFLGQFQHYDDRFLEPSRSIMQRTKTYHFPSLINYLTGGEISGHFLHHLFPELPYYHVEQARKILVADSRLAGMFAIY